MVFTLMPKYAYNNFSEFLSKYEKPLDTLSNLSTHLNLENKIRMSNVKRIDNDCFYYFPFEDNCEELNCFEKSMSMFLGVREVLPNSNPKLLFIDQGQRGTHAICIFNYENLLYAADPNYGILNPIYLQENSVEVLTEKLEYKRSVKFDSFQVLSEDDLYLKIVRLRGSKGIVEYFSGAGQIIERDYSLFLPYEIFGYYQENNFVIEKRISNFIPIMNVVFRFSFNKDGSRNNSLLLFSNKDWRDLDDIVELAKVNVFSSGKMIQRYINYKNLDSYIMNNMVNQCFYMDFLDEKRKKNKKSSKSTFAFNKNIRKSVEEVCIKDDNSGVFEWGRKKSEHFFQHILDYSYGYGCTKSDIEKKRISFDEYRMKNIGRIKQLVNRFSNVMIDDEQALDFNKLGVKIRDKIKKDS